MNRPPRPPRPSAVRRYAVRGSAVLAAVLALALLAGCDDPPMPSGLVSKSADGADKLEMCPHTPSLPPVSNGLPDLSLPCLGIGPDIRLADLRGPLLINVWAQWCPPCRQESPYLAELHRKAGTKVQLIGIDYDDPLPVQAIKFAVEQKLDYPHLVDTDKQTRVPFQIGGPPLTVFVDAKGAMVHVHYGAFKSQQELDQLVKDKLGVSW